MKKTICLFFFMMAFSFAGCQRGGPIQPSNGLVFTTSWPVLQTRALRDAVIRELAAGTRTLYEVQVGRLSCGFITDYNNSPAPRLRFNGAPGDLGFNLTFSSLRLNGVGVPSSSLCVSGTNDIPTEVVIQSDRGLVEDQVSKGGVMTVTFGNDIFTGDYTEFTLTDVNSANRIAAGKFEMFATNHGNPQDRRVLVVVDGSFRTTY